MYDFLSKYLMSEDDLVENGYPRPCPSAPGKAVFKTRKEQPKDCKYLLCLWVMLWILWGLQFRTTAAKATWKLLPFAFDCEAWTFFCACLFETVSHTDNCVGWTNESVSFGARNYQSALFGRKEKGLINNGTGRIERGLIANWIKYSIGYDDELSTEVIIPYFNFNKIRNNFNQIQSCNLFFILNNLSFFCSLTEDLLSLWQAFCCTWRWEVLNERRMRVSCREIISKKRWRFVLTVYVRLRSFLACTYMYCFIFNHLVVMITL